MMPPAAVPTFALRMALAALLLAVLALGVGPALAASPFGVGLAEPVAAPGGVLSPVFAWIAAWQISFYTGLKAAIRGLDGDGSAGWMLAGLSFAYGVFHAAGPGHGKAVVSSYVLANAETARNGALLSLLSALAQAATAIAVVSVGAVLLGVTGIAMTRFAAVLEIGSFALITGLGLWLVWQKALGPALKAVGGRLRAPARPALSAAGAFGAPASRSGFAFTAAAPATGAASERGAAALRLRPRPAAKSGGFTCEEGSHADDCGCGHAHAPAAAQAAGRLDIAKAWSAILAVGLRPCTGALIVLVFALSQGHYLAGVGATLAMGLGTGLTVAALVLVAVSARGLAVRFAKADNGRGRLVHRAVEIGGALAVLAFGALMLGGAIAAA
ncbi:nickel/cobalt transporter [Methylobrevis albus]|uniref:Nickel/cobalt efflux system n=1 Tax=Methylobrevis albus TaxID=2793297 RepID=A0A931I5E2_9HYPH|nr:nickel/cobalt transporter [Methylobrevis albus]MBH0239540.1 nickel/cobalt transporter [Methylobrevis albus]